MSSSITVTNNGIWAFWFSCVVSFREEARKMILIEWNHLKAEQEHIVGFWSLGSSSCMDSLVLQYDSIDTNEKACNSMDLSYDNCAF